MSDTYKVPDIWSLDDDFDEGDSSSLNRPVAGSRHSKELPIGTHPIQLYTMATPNGVKATIMLEELLALGFDGAEYDAHLIKIGAGDQFGSGFVALNPNSKIPAMVDRSAAPHVTLFESGSILLHLAEKFGALIPTEPALRAQCLNWVFWQVGAAPYIGGGFGHFYKSAPEPDKYTIDRFTMEVKRQLSVLDQHLSAQKYMCGDEYTIADIMIWPWHGGLILNNLYDAAKFLDAGSYSNLNRWAEAILARPAVERGRMVTRIWGPLEGQLHERHDARDFDSKTQDKTVSSHVSVEDQEA